MVPRRMRTPVASIAPMRLALMKMLRRCTEVTKPSTLGAVRPAGANTTSLT